MSKYIECKKIEKFFDGLYDCADLTFEPNDHCCTADDCAHCKWREATNAIQKRILSIPAADVVSGESYRALSEQVSILTDKIIKIREIAGCRNA